MGDHPSARKLPVAARPRPSRTAHQWVHDEQVELEPIPQAQRVQCDICDASFSAPSNLLRHMRAFHNPNPASGISNA